MFVDVSSLQPQHSDYKCTIFVATMDFTAILFLAGKGKNKKTELFEMYVWMYTGMYSCTWGTPLITPPAVFSTRDWPHRQF